MLWGGDTDTHYFSSITHLRLIARNAHKWEEFTPSWWHGDLQPRIRIREITRGHWAWCEILGRKGTLSRLECNPFYQPKKQKKNRNGVQWTQPSVWSNCKRRYRRGWVYWRICRTCEVHQRFYSNQHVCCGTCHQNPFRQTASRHSNLLLPSEFIFRWRPAGDIVQDSSVHRLATRRQWDSIHQQHISHFPSLHNTECFYEHCLVSRAGTYTSTSLSKTLTICYSYPSCA